MNIGVHRIIGATLALCSATGNAAQLSVDDTLAKARSSDQQYISWHEHIIDDPVSAQVPFNGSDGLAMADLDLDGLSTLSPSTNPTQVMTQQSMTPTLKYP